MVKNSRLIFAAVILFSLLSQTVHSSPLIIKGVDGTWLPVLASSWSERGGGVMLKPAEGIDIAKLRKKLTDLFPDMTIEIINKNLFFPSTSVEILFGILNNVDVGINLKTEGFSKESLAKPVRKAAEEPASLKDEFIESVVENVAFEPSLGKLFVDIAIAKRAKKGDFAKLSGKHRILIPFKMTNGIADAEDESNKYFAALLFAKKGTKISFIPEKTENGRIIRILRFNITN